MYLWRTYAVSDCPCYNYYGVHNSCVIPKQWWWWRWRRRRWWWLNVSSTSYQRRTNRRTRRPRVRQVGDPVDGPVSNGPALPRRRRFPATHHQSRARATWRHSQLPVPVSRQRDGKSGSTADRVPQWKVDDRLEADAGRQWTKSSVRGQCAWTGFNEHWRTA